MEHLPAIFGDDSGVSGMVRGVSNLELQQVDVFYDANL